MRHPNFIPTRAHSSPTRGTSAGEDSPTLLIRRFLDIACAVTGTASCATAFWLMMVMF